MHFDLHDAALREYALSNVAAGICEEDKLVLPPYSYAAMFAVRTVDNKPEETTAEAPKEM